MDMPSVEMEVERVMNLVRGFGWEKTKEEILDGEVEVTIKKKVPGAEELRPGPGPS